MTATATRRRKATGITIDRATLLGALEDVGAAVPSRSPKPILQNVILSEGWLRATDLEIQIAVEIPWDDEPLLLPHARLRSILRESVGDDVTLIPDGTACTVKVGRGEWRLPVEDAAEFPAWEAASTDPVCTVPCDQFARAIRSVAYAYDPGSSRYALGALLVEVQDGEATFVATDGRRLACSHITTGQATDNWVAKPKAGDKKAPLIPVHAVEQMERVAAKKGRETESVSLDASASECVATFGGCVITARLIDGAFPRWRDVFPERDAKLHTVGISALRHATRAAAIVTTEQSKGVDYDFTSSGLTLSGRSAESGESTVACEVEESGTPCKVKLDPKFVGEMCGALLTLEGEPSVRISVAGPGDAVIFTYGEDDEYRSVIMPLAND